MSSCSEMSEASEEDANFVEGKGADRRCGRAGQAAAKAWWTLCNEKADSWFRAIAAGAKEPTTSLMIPRLGPPVKPFVVGQKLERGGDPADLDERHVMSSCPADLI